MTSLYELIKAMMWTLQVFSFSGMGFVVFSTISFALARFHGCDEQEPHENIKKFVQRVFVGLVLAFLPTISRLLLGGFDQYIIYKPNITLDTYLYVYEHNIDAYTHHTNFSYTLILVTMGLAILAGAVLCFLRLRKKHTEKIREADAASDNHANQPKTEITQKIEATKEIIECKSSTYRLHWSEGLKDTLDKLANYSASGRPITTKLSGDIDFLLQEFHSITESHKTFTSFATPELYEKAAVHLKDRMSLLEDSLKQVLDSLLFHEMLEMKVATNVLSQHHQQNTQKESPFVQQKNTEELVIKDNENQRLP